MQYLEANKKQEEVVAIQKELTKRMDITREEFAAIF